MEWRAAEAGQMSKYRIRIRYIMEYKYM
jgi:hypothetical protein